MLALLAVLALLAASLMTAFLDRTLPGLEGYAGKARLGLVILIEDKEAPRLANRVLAAGLADMGIGLAILPEPDMAAERRSPGLGGSAGAGGPDVSGRSASVGMSVSDDAAARLVGDVGRIQSETGLESGQIIYAANAGAIPALLDLLSRPASPSGQNQAQPASLPRPGGLLLILPDAADPLDPADLAALPDGLPVSITADAHAASAEQAAELFLMLTGEDSTLFPGLRGNQPLSAQTWLSVDGARRLTLLPALSSLNSGWSPRLHQTLVQAAATSLAAGTAGQTATAARLPVAAATIGNRTLLALLALLLWAAVPLLVILAKSVWTVSPEWLAGGSGRLTQASERERRLPAILEILLYLPAGLLALPVGSLLARLTGDERLILGFRFYALLGFYGWFHFLATRGRRHVLDGEPTAADTDRQTRFGSLSTWAPTLASALAASALLLVAGYWLQATTGRLVPSMRLVPAILTLALLFLLMLPALLPFARGFRHSIRGLPRVAALLHGLLPALFLFGLRLAENPADLIGALLATVSGMLLLLAARSVARSLGATVVHAFVPALAGLFVLLLFRPFPVF